MRQNTTGLLLLLGLLIGMMTGCSSAERHSWRPFSKRPCDCDQGYDPLNPGQRIAPTPINPGVGNQPSIQPPPITTQPPPGFSGQDNTPFLPEERENRLPSERWRTPQDPEARILPPDLSVPQPRVDEKRDKKPSVQTQPIEPSPDVGEKNIPDLPVDIPQFMEVKKDVYSGQKPFVEGLQWLKDKGFKTIIHVMQPDEDDTIARRQFEAKGFKYVSIKVSPQTLDRKVIDEFNHIIGDVTNHPVFVFDKNSALAGGLWYLHFRIIDRLSDDLARQEARRIGFKEDQDGIHRQMWLAIQKFLENRQAD